MLEDGWPFGIFLWTAAWWIISVWFGTSSCCRLAVPADKVSATSKQPERWGASLIPAVLWGGPQGSVDPTLGRGISHVQGGFFP